MITLQNVKEKNTPFSVIKKQLVLGSNTKPRYRLLETLIIKLSNGAIITIKEGFIWDLSSVPRRLWSLLPTDGDFEMATLIHDFLYINAKTLGYSQKFADKEMFIWSKAVNGTVNKLSIRNLDNYIRYLGVRLGGKKVYKKNLK